MSKNSNLSEDLYEFKMLRKTMHIGTGVLALSVVTIDRGGAVSIGVGILALLTVVAVLPSYLKYRKRIHMPRKRPSWTTKDWLNMAKLGGVLFAIGLVVALAGALSLSGVFGLPSLVLLLVSIPFYRLARKKELKKIQPPVGEKSSEGVSIVKNN